MTIPAQPNRGIQPQVSLAWDRSGTYTPAPNGRVYLVYTYLFGTSDTDVEVRSSTDSGATWSAPYGVSGNDTNSQFLPSIAVDQKNGDVAVAWLDARDDPNNVKVKLYGTVSGDGGNTYLPPVAIAAGQSDVRNTDFPERGLTTGNNTQTTLNDLDQNWAPNYWANNFQVSAMGEIHKIIGNTATQLTLDPTDQWSVAPPTGTQYQIVPSYTFDYGEYTGLAFYNGTFYPVWPDNSNSTNNNPDGGNTTLDLEQALRLRPDG
jgi:hypothetical protein